MNPERIFYVYAHYRKSDGRVFYVGKGCGRRAGKTQYRNQYWRRVAAKHGWLWRILKSDMPESCAFSLERALIETRSGLTNMTLGGGGQSGYKKSRATKRKMSENRKGKGLCPNPRNFHATKNQPSVWWNADGTIFKGSHVDIAEKFNLSLKLCRAVQTGEKFSVCGWKVVGIRNYPERRNEDETAYVFSHKRLPVFIGFRADFCKAYNLCNSKVGRLASGQKMTHKGWNCRAL